MTAGGRDFARGGLVGTGHGRHEQHIHPSDLVERHDPGNRQPAQEPAKHSAFTRQPIADFDETAHIARFDFKHRAVVTAARPINGRVLHIEAGGRPAYISRF